MRLYMLCIGFVKMQSMYKQRFRALSTARMLSLLHLDWMERDEKSLFSHIRRAVSLVKERYSYVINTSDTRIGIQTEGILHLVEYADVVYDKGNTAKR